MTKLKSKADIYRDRAEELLANAADFQDPANRKTITLLAEELSPWPTGWTNSPTPFPTVPNYRTRPRHA